MGGSIPGEEELIENSFVPSGTPADQQQFFSVFFVGYDFEKIINVEILQGHSFQIGNSVDSTGIIINESAARALGWGDDVVGKSLDQINNGNVARTGEVIGLMKDFHYRPLYDPIKPLVVRIGGGKLAIKVKSENLRGVIQYLENEWKTHFQDNPFRYSFMDDNFDNLYRNENKFSKTIQYFSFLAIFIACLDLLGLSSFTTENRKKEIGIRKVNGASILGLLGLLTKDFSKLILIAFVISIPISYFFGNLWLNNFAYRTEIGFVVFIAAGISALVLALITISYHTIRAALTNPINSLRYE